MTYGDMLIRAYEGEVSGHAFFLALARARAATDETQKLDLLAALEARTAAALAPLLTRDKLVARSQEDLIAEGARDAQSYSGLNWKDLNARFASDFAPFIDEFRATQKLSPAHDKELMALVTGHEVAIIAFAAHEATGSGDGTEHLQTYVQQLDSYLAHATGQASAKLSTMP